VFKKIAERIKQATEGRESIDPSSFDDPVAMSTDWGPLKGGGSSFCTHKMKRVGRARIEFRPTIGARLFSLLFAVVGIGILVGGTVAFFKAGNRPPLAPLLMMGGMGSIFAAVGFGIYYSMATPRVLDAKLGLYWRGRKDPSIPSQRAMLKTCVEFADIHAIQIIAERCSGGKNSSSYWSYELNLVQHDGQRVNIVDHGKVARIRKEADMLADLLGLPVWDGS